MKSNMRQTWYVVREDSIRNKVAWAAVLLGFLAGLQIALGVAAIIVGCAKFPLSIGPGIAVVILALPTLALSGLMKAIGCIDRNTEALNKNVITLCKIVHECLKEAEGNHRSTERMVELMCSGDGNEG